VIVWKGAKHGKQRTRQKQRKEEEKAGETKAAEEVAPASCKLKDLNKHPPIPQIPVGLRDGP
jgi:hypothetical protein